MLNKISGARRAYSNGGLRGLAFNATRYFLGPPVWIGLIDLHQGDTVVDLGGYIGDFARLAAKRVGPTGRVLTVEPNPHNLERLRKNCAEFDNIDIVDGAVTDSHGESELKINPDNPSGHRMRREVDDLADFNDNREWVSAKTYTLDSLCEEHGIDNPDFIKIDIEGGEIAALRGGPRMLDATNRIMVEAYHGHPDPEHGDRTCGPEVYRILHRHRFKLAVTEDYMVFGWREPSDKAPRHRRALFSLFAGAYGIDRV